MRTTLTIDEDVAEQTRALADRLHKSFKVVLNDALRAGLGQVQKTKTSRPYRTEPLPMGLKEGYNLDNIQELISRIEGEDAR